MKKIPSPRLFVRIPGERIGVLVGPEGSVKHYIEKKLMVKLQIESDAGGVTIIVSEQASDPSTFFTAKNVVTAIGRGFSPDHAFRLIRNDDEIFDYIDLRVIFGRSESDMRRMKGRIIGSNGKTRRLIEELSESSLVIYGHTIGIIGTFEQVDIARNAIQMILNGSQHLTVYKFLQRKRSDMKKQKLNLWENTKDLK
ncbi:KH domain-containing protein [Candidatus Bathyarchaeota archaeon]|nr:KH domain-containing protein [Candidatus Bathyarchaeota archaeon]